MNNLKLRYCLTAWLLIGIFSLTLSITALAAQKQDSIPYEDVFTNDWFYSYVQICYQTGILVGTSETTFHPKNAVTGSEAVAIACRLHQQRNDTAKIVQQQGRPWHTVYWEYAKEYGLITAEEYQDYLTSHSQYANGRLFFIQLIMRIFPNNSFPAKNNIEVIPDMDVTTEPGSHILRLYNAGVLTGRDEFGFFEADAYITRAEIAAIICRVLDPDLRISFALTPMPEGRELTPLNISDDIWALHDFDGEYLWAKNRKTGERTIFSPTGKQLIPAVRGDIRKGSDPIFSVHYAEEEEGIHTERVEYYNMEGVRITPKDYYSGTTFSDGYAVVQERIGSNFILIDTQGKEWETISNPEHFYAFAPISHGFVQLYDRHLLDTKGKKLQSIGYDTISNFSEGYLVVCNADGKYGFLNEALALQIPCNYSVAKDFCHDMAIVSNGEAFGAIDKSNRLVIPFAYRQLQDFTMEGVSVGEHLVDGVWKFVVINKENEILTTLPSEGIVHYDICGDFLIRNRDGVPSLLDLSGNDLFPGVDLRGIYPADNGSAILLVGEMYYFYSAI